MKKVLIKNLKSVQSIDGYTLVESMMTVFIFSIILAGIYSTSLAGDNLWQTNNVQIELQQETRKAMERMINELRQAGDSSITNVPHDGTWYSTITFKIPSGVSAGSISWNVNTIQSLLSGTQLQRISAGTTKVIGQDFQSIQFRRQSATPSTLEVTMQTRKTVPKRAAISYNLNFNVKLRN